ncbi:MAG: hypothetical protein ACFB21_13160 [Opitutales bacterium]
MPPVFDPFRTWARNRARTAAFTLLEVLLALGLFALAAGAFIQALTAGTDMMLRQRADGAAMQNVRFALRQLMRIESEEELEDGGEFTLPGDGFISWEAEIERTETVGLFRVEVTLEQELDSPDGGFQNEEVSNTFTLFLHRPSWGDPADNSELIRDKELQFDNRFDL